MTQSSKKMSVDMENDYQLELATRKLLFKSSEMNSRESVKTTGDVRGSGNESVAGEIPGAGTSAAKRPERHVRVKVTMNVDGDIIRHFKDQAEAAGRSYQLLINDALREYIDGSHHERIASDVRQQLLGDESFLKDVARRVKNAAEV